LAPRHTDYASYLEQLANQPQPVHGTLYVFVDECHRTQSGRLHTTMKRILPNAIFIGFTGTPLLREDAQTTYEVFGDYIHTYKFNEAVSDGVVLDLVYEARTIDQSLTSPNRVDAWFDARDRRSQRMAKASAARAMGYTATRAQLTVTHGSNRQRHRL
jgi:type I restriction enzyme R subunit